MPQMRKHAPKGADERIRELAANGASKVGIARAFRVSFITLNKWLEADERLQRAFDEGREAERHTLHTSLYRQATEKGNIVAAIFLLKSRHGYVEGQQSEQTNKVAITFNLPAPMTPEDYKLAKVVTNSQKVLNADTSAATE